MNAALDNTAMPRRDLMRPLRYFVRVPLLLLHIVIAPPLAIFVFSPLGAKLRVRGERFDHWATRWWSSALIRRFGFRIRRIGEPLPGATLFVANHVSWMDIELMHSQRMMSFVAKSEIARWPFVGWLATRAGTIYHQRGSTHSLASVTENVVAHLKSSGSAGIFPEGGTGPGDKVRTFHARIFQVAVDAQAPIQPVALCYGKNGKMDLSVPFGANESFFGNFVRLLGGPGMDAEVHFLEPFAVDGEGRREIAETARARIAAALGYE